MPLPSKVFLCEVNKVASEQMVMIDGRKIKLTNLEKLMWSEENITKGEVVKYFTDVAPVLLPHLKDRPLVLTRYPQGWQGKNFYQKNAPEHTPEWVKTAPLPSEKRVINYILAETTADLVWLANQAAFEIHPFLSRVQSIDEPDYAVFDLDPMENTTWEDVRTTALAVRAALSHYNLRAYPKTTGGDGLQIFLPLVAGFSYEDVRTFALGLSQAVHGVLPDITTLIRKPSEREGKMYLDYLQNVKGKTLVSVYAIRPRPLATVSTPVTWDEMESDSVRKDEFTIRTLRQRLEKHGDLFAPTLFDKQNIRPVLKLFSR